MIIEGGVSKSQFQTGIWQVASCKDPPLKNFFLFDGADCVGCVENIGRWPRQIQLTFPNIATRPRLPISKFIFCFVLNLCSSACICTVRSSLCEERCSFSALWRSAGDLQWITAGPDAILERNFQTDVSFGSFEHFVIVLYTEWAKALIMKCAKCF